MQMTGRTWHIGIFGTFDVENYGDLLFPILAEAELSKRLGAVQLHRFSYNAKSPAEWPYAVTSVSDLPELAEQPHGLLVIAGADCPAARRPGDLERPGHALQ